MIGGDYADVWYNFPIMRCNHFILDIQKIMPKMCEIIEKMQDQGVFFQILGLTVLTEGSSLPVHTDNVGPEFGDMACNMLLRGTGTLSI